MSSPRSIADVLRANLCVSCGACEGIADSPRLRLMRHASLHYDVPEGEAAVLAQPDSPEFRVCPGPGMALDALSRERFGEGPSSLELGRYRAAVAARSTNPEVIKRASSGGVMTEIARYLLREGSIDAAVVTGFTYGAGGPVPKTFLARTAEELHAAQGSKYCPTSTNRIVAQCRREGGRYLFVGTPCQVAALRLAIRQDPALERIFPFTMGNFCGGFRDYRMAEALLARHGVNPADVKAFQFRGGGQPGGMRVEDATGRVVTEPYPDYARGLRIAKLKRCLFCIDGTAELADFACGDAWLPRYQKDSNPWSIVLARSAIAAEVLDTMHKRGFLVCEPVSASEVIRSQASNLTSKKYRQRKRMILCRLFGATLPVWDIKLPNGGSYLSEARTLISKKLSDWGFTRSSGRGGGL